MATAKTVIFSYRDKRLDNAEGFWDAWNQFNILFAADAEEVARG